MRKAMVLGVVALAGTLASPAFADEFTGFRIGASIGQDRLETDVNYLGYTEDVRASRFAYGLMGGWALNKYLAFEVGYNDGSEFSREIESNGAFPDRFVRQHTDLRAFEASVVGAWWFNPKLSIFGRAGIYAWDAETTYVEDIDVGNDDPPLSRQTFDSDGQDPFIAVGLQTELDGALLRLEYRLIETDDLEVPGQLTWDDTKMSSIQLSVAWILH